MAAIRNLCLTDNLGLKKFEGVHLARKSRKKEDIDSYRHEAETRINAVPVGLASYDISKPKPKEYEYDPHLDPVRKQATQFPLIRNKYLMEFIAEYRNVLVGLQALYKLSNRVDPQVVLSGKKEHTAFEVPAVSLCTNRALRGFSIILP